MYPSSRRPRPLSTTATLPALLFAALLLAASVSAVLAVDFDFDAHLTRLHSLLARADQHPALLLERLNFETSGPLPVIEDLGPGLGWEFDSSPYYIVQLSGPILEEWREQLDALGVRRYDYLPANAYLVRMEDKLAEQVQALPQVHRVLPWHPLFRVAAALERDLTAWSVEDAPDQAELLVRISPDEDAETLAALLAEELGGRVEEILPGQRDTLIGVSVKWEPALLGRVWQAAQLPGVFWIEKRPTYHIINTNAAWVTQSFIPGYTSIWERGLSGHFQVVGCADTGLDPDHCVFNDATQPLPGAIPNAKHRKIIMYEDWAGNGDWDADGHGTHVGGSIAGDNELNLLVPDNYDGMAYAAKLAFQDIGNGQSLTGVPRDLKQLFTSAYAAGARLHSNSWGSSQNTYTTHSRNIDEFTWDNPDFLVLFANGNDGPQERTVGEPATAKSLLSVGAANNGQGATSMTNFSSRGPASDGRFKPTLAAPGVITSARTNRNPTSPSCTYFTTQGTSMSTPVTAGCAALVREYFARGWFPTGEADSNFAFSPSASLVKAVMVNGASWMRSDNPAPNNSQGWGRVFLEDSLFFTGDNLPVDLFEQAEGLATGEQVTLNTFVASSAKPLKITLVWSDYPASTSASTALVNNLNLLVTAPDGKTYRGNALQNGYSIANSTATDQLNEIEQVHVQAPVPGQWQIQILAANVPQGSQKFSLAFSGDLIFERGAVVLDKNAYGCGDTMVITVQDSGLQTAQSTTVRVASSLLPQGRTITLPAVSGQPGVFRASVTTGDSNLPVEDGGWLTVSYLDANDGFGRTNQLKTVHAGVDCTPPVISDMQIVALSESSFRVSWKTDELAFGRIRYGLTNPPTTLSAEHNLRTEHSVTVENATACGIYSVEIVVRDNSLNTATGPVPYLTIELPKANVSYFRDWELGSPTTGGSWTPSNNDWNFTWTRARSGRRSLKMRHRDSATTTLTSPDFTIPNGLPVSFEFYSQFDFEQNWDGGIIEVSYDGGTSWEKRAPVEGYTARTDIRVRNCLGPNQPVFTGTALSDWQRFTLDLTEFAGETIRIRFKFCSDDNTGGQGWFLDDLRLFNLQPCGVSLSLASTRLVETTLATCHDDDGIPDSGETFRLELELLNSGAQALGSSEMSIASLHPAVTLAASTISVPTLAANGGRATVSVTGAVAETSVCNELAEFSIALPAVSPLLTAEPTFPLNQDRTSTAGLWFDQVQPGDDDWQVEGLWEKSSRRSFSGTQAWFSGSIDTLCARLVSPPISLSADANALLSFKTWFEFENSYDGGAVEITLDGGRTWEFRQPISGYVTSLGTRTLSCLGQGTPAYSGSSGGWYDSAFDLRDLKGKTVQIGFRVGNNTVTNLEGWYIDDISVTNAVVETYLCDSDPCDRVDSTPPQVSDVQVWAAQSNLRGYFQGSWTGSDDASGIAEYYVGIGQQPGSNNAFGWMSVERNTSLTLTSPVLNSNASYYLTVRARDSAGNWSAPASSTAVFIDHEPPVTSIISPTNGSRLTLETLRVRGGASESSGGSGLAFTEVSFDNGQNWAQVGTRASWTVDIPVPASGSYRIMARSHDNIGNIGTPAEVTVEIILPRPPRFYLAGYLDTRLSVGPGQTWTMIAYVPDPDVAKVEVFYAGIGTGLELFDRGTIGDATAGDFVFTRRIPELTFTDPLSVLLELRAVDAQGALSPLWPYLTVE